MEEISNPGLILSDTAKQEMASVARWAKYLAIAGFIVCGLIVLFGVLAGVILIAFYSFGTYNTELNDLPSWITVPVYLLMTAICFVPCLRLYNFSVKTQEAIQSGSDEALIQAFTNLHKCFKFVGIITITAMGLYALTRIGIGIAYVTGLLSN
jgi:uncharacterized membrane protein